MENSTKTSMGLLALTSCFTLSSHAAVVINEIDYDQPGTDRAEFIELFNAGSSAISLDNYTIDLINGLNSSADFSSSVLNHASAAYRPSIPDSGIQKDPCFFQISQK